jgi:hypothetical protein
MPRRKNPENRTAREEIASVIDWAERQGFADAPVIEALRHKPTRDTVLAAIQWGDQHGFPHLDQNYLSPSARRHQSRPI